MKEIGETSLKALAQIADMRAEQSGLIGAKPSLRYSSPWPWLFAIGISAVLWAVVAVVAWLFWTHLITPSKPIVERTEVASEWGRPIAATPVGGAKSLRIEFVTHCSGQRLCPLQSLLAVNLVRI